MVKKPTQKEKEMLELSKYLAEKYNKSKTSKSKRKWYDLLMSNETRILEAQK